MEELNDLEKQFCEMIDFKLFVDDEVFQTYSKKFACWKPKFDRNKETYLNYDN